jgi:hypothetical protein
MEDTMAYTDWAALANQAAEDKESVTALIDGMVDLFDYVAAIKGERYRWARHRVTDGINSAIDDATTLLGVIEKKLSEYSGKAVEQEEREFAEAHRAANAQEIGGGT